MNEAPKLRTNLVILCSVLITLLFFQYPLMILHQILDKDLQNYNRFAITTGRGDSAYGYDINLFGSDIISAYKKPGLFLKDSISYEHKNEIIPLQGIFPYVLHAILYAIIKDITSTLILGSAISVILITILLYFVSKLLHKKHEINFSIKNTLLFSLAFFTFPDALYTLPKIIFSKSEMIRPYIGYIGRFININHIVIFLLIWFGILIHILIRDEEKKIYFVFLGVSLAVLQYSYVYFYTSALIFTFFVFFIKYGARKKTLLKMMWIYCTWFLLSIPFALNYLKYSQFNREFIMRSRAIVTDIPTYRFTIAITFIFLILFCCVNYIDNRLRKEKLIVLNSLRDSSLIVSLFLTSLIVFNIQYVVGYTVQPYHWKSAFIIPMLILISYMYFLKITKMVYIHLKNKKISLFIKNSLNASVSFVLIILFVCTVLHLSTSAKHFYKYYYFDDEDVGLIDYIKQKSEKDDVFFADTSYTTDIINVNTERKTLLGHIFHSRVSIDEVHQRLLFGYEKLEFSKEKLILDIKKSNGYITNFLARVRSLQLKNHYENWNNIHLYYHDLYYNSIRQEFDNNKLIKDILGFYDKPRVKFKLDYIVYSVNLKSHTSDPNIVFRNRRYLIKKTHITQYLFSYDEELAPIMRFH